MRYVLIFVILLLFSGCANKETIIRYKYIPCKVPNELFTCKDAKPFMLDKNTTKNDWRKHIIELKIGYESCKRQLEIVQERLQHSK